MRVPSLLALALLLTLCPLLYACPKKEGDTTVIRMPDKTPSAQNQNDDSADTAILLPRERPTGDVYVYVPLERYHTSEPIDTEYRYSGDNAGKVYVDVIPVADASAQRAAATDPKLHYELDSPTSSVQVAVPGEGRYIVRMSRDTGSSVEVLSESEPFEVVRWESGDATARKAPYVTISGDDGTVVSQVAVGEPVRARFVVPPGFPPDAWIAVVPAGTDPADVDMSTVQMVKVSELTDGVYEYTPPADGNYVFRIYPTSEPVYSVAESEPFTVGAGSTEPPMGNDQGGPPTGNDDGSPPTGNDDGSPPTGNDDGSPPTGNDDGSPPVGNDNGDPDGNAPG